MLTDSACLEEIQLKLYEIRRLSATCSRWQFIRDHLSDCCRCSGFTLSLKVIAEDSLTDLSHLVSQLMVVPLELIYIGKSATKI